MVINGIVMGGAAASSTRTNRKCRYRKGLETEHSRYSDSMTAQNLVPLDLDTYIILHHLPSCGRRSTIGVKKFGRHCTLDAIGMDACRRRNTPHKYLDAPGGEPIPFNSIDVGSHDLL